MKKNRLNVRWESRFAVGLGMVIGWAVILGSAGCPGGDVMNDGDPPTQKTCTTGTAAAVTTVSFSRDIEPMLVGAGCLSAGCHGAVQLSSSYSMLSYEDMFEAGEEATSLDLCPIVPGDPDASYLIEKLRPFPRSGAVMPYLRPQMNDEEIGLIETWIREGAADN